MFRFIINRKYIDLLVSMMMTDRTIKEISKRIGMSYFHLTEVLNQFYKEGLLKKNVDKNTYRFSLTEKGKKIVELLLEIQQIYKKGETK